MSRTRYDNLFIRNMQIFVVYIYLVVHGSCWMAEKCFVYEDYVDIGVFTQCPKSSLTAYCRYINNVTLDLARVPPNVEVFCLEFEKHSILPSYSLSRFQNLRYLQIQGKILAILPGAFKNLSKLQHLNLYCFNYSKISLSSEVLGDLHNLRSMTFIYCKASSMAVDVFRRNVKLEGLDFYEPKDFSEVLCRLAFVSSSLKRLSLTLPSTTLRHPQCRFTNGTSFVVGKFHSLEYVSLHFGKVTVFDKTVLKYIQNFSKLTIDWKDFQMLRPEIKKVDCLVLSVTQRSSLDILEDICKTITELSTTVLTTEFFHATNYSLSSLENCSKLEIFRITGTDNSLFTGSVKNLIRLKEVREVNNESGGVLSLCENQHITAIKLKSLYLTTQKIRNVRNQQLHCLRELEVLGWTGSNIEYIEDDSFSNNRLLKEIDMSYNKISKLTAYTFSGLINLETLMLEHNPLTFIEELTFMHLKSLRNLNLRLFPDPLVEASQIQLNLGLLFGIFPENLTQLYIDSGINPMKLILGNESKSKADLNLYIISSSITFYDCEGPLFESLVQLTVQANHMLCDQSFPARFLKSLKHLEITLWHKTAQIDLTDLNQLVHLKSLAIRNVDFSLQPNVDVMFHNLSSLERLVLSSSWIPLLDNGLSRDLKSLKVLFIDIDDMIIVTESFLEPLKNLRYLLMDEPLFRCSCEHVWLIEWAKYQQHVQVFLSWSSVEKVQCKAVEKTEFLSTYIKDQCIMDFGFLLFASSTVGLLFFLLVVLLHQLTGDYLMAFFHIAQGWVEEATRGNRGGHYNFDVFVSYCGKDEQWVVDELLPNLEKRGPPFIRLCLHSRDFQPGKDIVENITDSLYRSRYTLCLVSRNYLRSNWCSLEMRLATYRLLAEHKDILVLIFLEKVPHQLISVHHRLARLLKTKTYIDWPQDPAQRNAFWDRLWTKLSSESAI